MPSTRQKHRGFRERVWERGNTRGWKHPAPLSALLSCPQAAPTSTFQQIFPEGVPGHCYPNTGMLCHACFSQGARAREQLSPGTAVTPAAGHGAVPARRGWQLHTTAWKGSSSSQDGLPVQGDQQAVPENSLTYGTRIPASPAPHRGRLPATQQMPCSTLIQEGVKDFSPTLGPPAALGVCPDPWSTGTEWEHP